MKTRIKRIAALAVIGFCVLSARQAASTATADDPTPEGVEFFEKKIRPALEANCYMCHSAKTKKPQAGLLLDSRDGMLKGGASGLPAVVPGDPEKSLLIKAIRYADPKLQMPPGEQLTAEVVKDFETWIKMGAPDPRKPDAPTSTAWQPYDLKEARKFWSLQPIKDSSPPQVKDSKWAASPVDRFILAKLEEKGLRPVRQADKLTLIRRATFDLTGLPPTPEEVAAFLQDNSDKVFEKVIDRLLASPHYGERWGRHWLDVVRYADTAGCNSDFPVPSAYKYRNYVIKSFNTDKPYDQFIREQIAGDLLPNKTDAEKYERIIATGYLAISRRFGSGANEFHLTLDDTIDNVGKAFLGLSVSCARCHDHKFDPIPMRDYYAMYGILGSARYAFPGTELYRHTKDFVPLAPPNEAARLVKWQTELAGLGEKFEKLKNEKRAIEARNTQAAKEGEPPKAEQPSERTVAQVTAEMDAVKARIAELENNIPNVEKAYAVSEGKPANARVHRKGDPKNKGDEVPRGFLQILGGQQLPEGEKGSGRLQLAEWMSDAKNPLTARVMVNRIWQRHFGKGVVQTPNDFGTRGKAPTHPELLDYLAARFIESGWSVKAMHRLIMLTSAYQLASVDDARNAAADVNNDLLWKFNRRRLDAEEIRDAMLAASGALDRAQPQGHPFPPENQWRYTQHHPFVADYESSYRSVYLMQQRIKKHPWLEVFDGADANATTAERSFSTTPIQALFMMNDPFVHKQADNFAVRVGLAYDEDSKRVAYAYRLVYGRQATKEEVRMGEDYLRQLRQDLRETDLPAEQYTRAALASFARVLFSSNEFLFVD